MCIRDRETRERPRSARVRYEDLRRVDLDVEHVDAGELLEEDGLALHDRL